MHVTVNRRFLIVLIAIVVLSGAAIHGLHAVQIRRQSGFLLENAHRAMKERQFEQAIGYFQKYVTLVPADMAAQAEFGLLLADQHMSQAAAATLEKVLRNEPERDDIRRRLVEIEMEIGHFRDAAEHLQKYLLKTTPNDGILWRQLGNSEIGLGDYDEAVNALRRAIHLAPQEVDAYASLADVLRRQLDRGQDADACMEELTKSNPKSARAHFLLANYLASADPNASAPAEAREAALKEAQRAIDLNPKETAALLLSARLYAANGEFKDAAARAQRAIAADPAAPAGYMTLADIHHRAGNDKDAIACLEAGTNAVVPTNGAMLWTLGRLRLQAGDVAKAQASVEEMQKLPNDERLEPLVGFLQAQIEMANQDWQRAVDGFEQIAVKLSGTPDLLTEARCREAICQEKLGDRDLELAAYREAAQVDPSWAPARLGVASTLLSLGKLDEALDEYRQISRLDGMAEAGAEGAAKLLILKNRAAPSGERNWDEVDSMLQQLDAKNPNSKRITLLKAESLASRNRLADAEKLLLEAKNKSPTDTEIWLAIVGLTVDQQQWDRADKYLTEADARFGDQVWLRLARASYLVARYKQESASHLKPLAEDVGRFKSQDCFLLYRRLAALMFEAGNVADAKSLARRACNADPKNLEARVYLLDLGMSDGDQALVKKGLEEIHELEGEGPFWHYGQAALCLVTKPATPALAQTAFENLAIARKLRPGWAQVPLLTAQIEDRQGQSDAALQDYLLAINLGARSPFSIRRAVELLYSKQRFNEADHLLRDFEQNSSLFTSELGRMASEISARLEDLDRSLQIARRVAANSNDWRDHLWLGQLVGLVAMRARASNQLDEATRDLAEAEKSLRLANKLAPTMPATWLALVQFLAATDRKPEAENLIHEAEHQLPAKTSGLALAACYEAIGDRAQAASQYQSALTKAGNDPAVLRGAAEFYLRSGNLPKAEEQLRLLTSGRYATKPDDLAWGRRILAAVLRSSGQYRKLEQALALVRQNLASGSNSPDDLREEALELAVFPEPDRRQQATKILEEVLQNRATDAEARIALAGLYLAGDDWPKASEQLRALVTNHDNDPRYMALYVSRLLEHRETAEAELWLNRLDQLAPLELSTATLRAQSLAQLGNIDGAIAAVAKHFAQPIPHDAIAGQLEMAAVGLEALARSAPGAKGVAEPKLLAAAEDYFRKLVRAQPNKLMVLAMFLARSHRYDESLAIVESTAPKTSPSALAELCVAILGSGPDQANREQRVEKLLLAAIARENGSGGNPQVAPLLLAMANLRMQQNRLDDAAGIYRGVLKGDPSNVVAMNNLALLEANQKSRLDESLELIDRAIALAGPLPALLDSRGSIFLAEGKAQQALADFSQAATEEPRPNRQLHRAMAYLQLGQSDGASQALATARKLGLDPLQLSTPDRRDYQQLIAKLGSRG